MNEPTTPPDLLVKIQTFENTFCRNVSHVQIKGNYDRRIHMKFSLHQIFILTQFNDLIESLFDGIHTDTGHPDRSSGTMENVFILKLSHNLIILQAY